MAPRLPYFGGMNIHDYMDHDPNPPLEWLCLKIGFFIFPKSRWLMLIIIFPPKTAMDLWGKEACNLVDELQVDGSIEKIRWHAQPRVLPGNPHGFVQEESDD